MNSIADKVRNTQFFDGNFIFPLLYKFGGVRGVTKWVIFKF